MSGIQVSVANFHRVVVENCDEHCVDNNRCYTRVMFYDEEGNELLMIHMHYHNTAINTLTTTDLENDNGNT